MRLGFLLLVLAAAAIAVPQLEIKAANVEALKKQRDCLLLLQQVFQDIPNLELRKIGKEYDIEGNPDGYRDQDVVKYLILSVKQGHVQPKGAPFSSSIAKLRKDLAVLTRTFLTAKDYDTFLKTAAWARYYLNEEQFVKAFVAAILQRPDTRDFVDLPALYEIFPYYFFDARVIRRAQDLRAKSIDETLSNPVIEIPVDYGTAWLPKGESSLAYFTQDIGLASYYAHFALAGEMLPEAALTKSNSSSPNLNRDRYEIGRGSQYYYVHQQLLARYDLERLSNNLLPIQDTDWSRVRTPFKPHLSYPNGLEFPGRSFDVNLLPEKEELIKTAWILERRLKDAIDSGFTFSAQRSILALYEPQGLNVLGNLIESTGRSINPRFYGSLQGAARELLGGAQYTCCLFEPTPAALEIPETATRDPVFYKLYKRIISLFKRYQDSLPFYTEDDLILPGVSIEDVKFNKLVTYCDKFEADIDSATIIPSEKNKENIQIKAVVDRLNHEPIEFKIIVNSEKLIKGAVVRVYIGPKFNFDGSPISITENRLRFVELDQFNYDIKKGRNIILRNSKDCPMRSFDSYTKRDLLHKVEDAFNSHQPFYPTTIAQRYGFPERLALPKGKRDGLPLQVVAIVSSPKAKTVTYGPVVSPRFQTYQDVDFGDYLSKYPEDIDTEDVDDRADLHENRDTRFERYERRIGNKLFGSKKDKDDDFESSEVHTGTDSHKVSSDDTVDRQVEYLTEYYKDKHTYEMIGGAISLDGRPLGYPFDRPMAKGGLFIPNVKCIDVKVFFKGGDCPC